MKIFVLSIGILYAGIVQAFNCKTFLIKEQFRIAAKLKMQKNNTFSTILYKKSLKEDLQEIQKTRRLINEVSNNLLGPQTKYILSQTEGYLTNNERREQLNWMYKNNAFCTESPPNGKGRFNKMSFLSLDEISMILKDGLIEKLRKQK